MGATVPPDLLGACLPACLISLVETLSGPWEPAHLSPVSPLRAGSDMAPCLGPWNPGCQRLCQSPSHLRGRPSPEQQSHTPSPIPPDLSPRPAPCQGPRVLLVAQPVPRGPGPASCGQRLGVQAHPEPGVRLAPAPWCCTAFLFCSSPVPMALSLLRPDWSLPMPRGGQAHSLRCRKVGRDEVGSYPEPQGTGSVPGHGPREGASTPLWNTPLVFPKSQHWAGS